MNADYEELIRSNRVAPQTRRALLERARLDHEALSNPFLLSDQLAILNAVVDRLVPQTSSQSRIDIVRALDSNKRAQAGDGWRYADMPPDDIAMRLGLALLNRDATQLHDLPFVSLDSEQQDALLLTLQNGEAVWKEMNAQHWFEDLICDAIEIYVSHPGTLHALGFSGFAFLPRWSTVSLGSREDWEPVSE